MTRLEHANLTVPDIDAAIAFIQIVAPDFQIRHDAVDAAGYRWVHIGNSQHYLALQEPHLDATPEFPRPPYKNYGCNHLGLVVGNVDATAAALLSAGYRPGIETPDETTRKRRYFFDRAGFEWEIIEYLSDSIEDRYRHETSR